MSNRQTYLCSCAKKPSWKKNYRLSGTWAHDLGDCGAHCSTITAIIIWGLEKRELMRGTTYWMNTLQYISTLYEMSWSEEFEMCDDYFNVIHFFNFMWHFKDHILPQGHFPIKTKWQCFSLYKDVWYKISCLWNLMQIIER